MTILQDKQNKIEQLREMGIELYPSFSAKEHVKRNRCSAVAMMKPEDAGLSMAICGRIVRFNNKGAITFIHIEDEYGKAQVVFKKANFSEEQYRLFKEKLIERDDFIYVTGTFFITNSGEKSLDATSFELLAKSHQPLPVIKEVVSEDNAVKQYGEFNDKEERFRQRYADLAVNDEVRRRFKLRARVISHIRSFLDIKMGMIEVETPILQPVYGGAAARPFTTHHNQLNQNMFLRISFELYLKRLLVGGFDSVYEIGRDFRNEGVSYKHNPEFTMLEFYKAYANLYDCMDIVEEMLKNIIWAIFFPKYEFDYQEHHLDFTTFNRITMRDAILEKTGIDVYQYQQTIVVLLALQNKGLSVPIKDMEQDYGKTVLDIFEHFVEKDLIQPTFVYEYPKSVSPFAKDAKREGYVERFELFIAGMEFGNAFTELNDPDIQEARFREMAALYKNGEDEETPFDEDYLNAMRYGMPPNTGFGMGIDRLMMLLTNQSSIKEVILYPHLKS